MFRIQRSTTNPLETLKKKKKRNNLIFNIYDIFFKNCFLLCFAKYKKKTAPKKQENKHTYTYTHKHTHTHIYIYIDKKKNLNKNLPICLGLQNTPIASLQRGKAPPTTNECPAYDTKQSDGEVPVMMELWRMQSTPSLPSLQGPLWPEVVTPNRVLLWVKLN